MQLPLPWKNILKMIFSLVMVIGLAQMAFHIRQLLILTGLQIRVHIGELFFFISHRKHMLWVLKRTV